MDLAMELSKDQQIWFDTIYDWYKSCKYNSTSIVMSGFAGTGKTTILGKLVDSFHKDGFSVACATFTGKASIVLSQKINNYYNNYIGTIHGLIYKPVTDKDGMLSGFKRAKSIDFDVIIVDECSMINKEIQKDLLSFGVPVVFIGDSFQLPPISKDNFNIFEKTSYELKTIHRQAENSPIIKLSMRIRNGEYIDYGIYGRGCAKMNWRDEKAQKALFNHNPNSNDIILCGMNKTRIAINNLMREKQNFNKPEPKKDDKIVCLQNNHSLGIMNGQLGFINDVKLFKDYAYIINMNFGNYDQKHFVYKDGFGKINQSEYFGVCTKQSTKGDLKKERFEKLDLFDFGYALSVHKS